ncbi:hypothetical protein ACOME3_008685 [Neoechinorhynchus agilis]
MRPVGKPTTMMAFLSMLLLLLILFTFGMLVTSGLYNLFLLKEHDYFADYTSTAISAYQLSISVFVLTTSFLALIMMSCLRKRSLYQHFILNQMLNIFLMVILLGVIAIIVNGLPSKISSILKKAFDSYATSEDTERRINRLQADHKCCGFHNFTDFGSSVPQSCYPTSTENQTERSPFSQGCHDALLRQYKKLYDTLMPVVLSASIATSLALIFSYFFERVLKKRRILH